MLPSSANRRSEPHGDYGVVITENCRFFPLGPKRSRSTRNGPTSTKVQEHCDPADPADAQRGDWWDHTAFDAEQ